MGVPLPPGGGGGGTGPTSLPKQGDCHCFPMTESLRGWTGPVRQPAKLNQKVSILPVLSGVKVL